MEMSWEWELRVHVVHHTSIIRIVQQDHMIVLRPNKLVKQDTSFIISIQLCVCVVHAYRGNSVARLTNLTN